MTGVGFPHSGISGSVPARGSPERVVVRHALHRLLAPRHPPTALCSLTDQAEASWAAGEPAAQTRQVKLTSFLEGYPIAAAVFKVLPASGTLPGGGGSARGAARAARRKSSGLAQVEASGLEPLTYCVQSNRSPS